MSTQEHTVSTVDAAREDVYRFLAAAVSDPRSQRWTPVADESVRHRVATAADVLRSEMTHVDLGYGERPLDELVVSVTDIEASRDDWIRRYDGTFGLVPSREFPPYETEYLANAEPSFRAQQLADVAGYYRAFGLRPSRDTAERPDHVALELEFMAALIHLRRQALTDEQFAVTHDAESSFFRDHLAWWLPAFARLLGQKSPNGPYATVARLLGAFLPRERHRFGVDPPAMPRQSLPVIQTDDVTGDAACSA